MFLNTVKNIKRLMCDDSGSVMIMLAIFIVIMVAIAGAGVDFGRAHLLKMKEQQSSDVAALAAATITTNDAQTREDTAFRYYNLNFPSTYIGVSRTTPSYNFDNSNTNGNIGIINVSGSSIMPTNYIATMGVSNLQIDAKTSVAIPDNELPDFDVVVVVDESGSTSAILPTGKTIIQTEKDSITDMLDVLFPDNQPINNNIRFGVIGYSGAIIQAFGLTSDKAQAQSYINSLDWYFQNYDHWALEAGFNMVTGVWNGFVAPNFCSLHQASSDPLTGLTCIPQRNTGVPAAVTPRGDGNLVSSAKHIVLITDGYIMEEPAPCLDGINYQTAANGAYTEEYLSTDTCKNYRVFLDKCTAIKNAGITLHVVDFISLSPSDITPMTQCASVDGSGNPRFFYAPDGAALQNILTGIASTIRRIKITD